ncbi:MAG: DUF4197 domain-containing protein [Bacteroidota bacterium]
MKRASYLIAGIMAVALIACTQAQIDQMTKTVNDMNTGGGGNKLTNEEVIQGLKEALSVGTNNSAGMASKLDGFYKNPLIFIPFPPEAIKVKEKVEQLGMKDQVDKFVMTLNRGAEEAAKEAGPIFLNAIKSMSIGDGFAILKGGEGAATKYLSDKTGTQLHATFKPKVQDALKKVAITNYWHPVINTYNKIPGVQKQNPDLDEYVTIKAKEGLFKLIAIEENKIRKDPVARVSDILKKVFGSQY